MDDFTIILSELINLASCDLKVFYGLDRLWRMVERYKMTTPITITVVDEMARQVREIRGCRNQGGAWQLKDTPTAATPPIDEELEFPLILKVQDANGNILKMRVQREGMKPVLSPKKADPH